MREGIFFFIYMHIGPIFRFHFIITIQREIGVVSLRSIQVKRCENLNADFFTVVFIIPPLPKGGGGYTVLPLSVCLSFRPSKILFVTIFSVTVDGRNLIFGHKHHIGTPYRGKHFWTHQIPTSCLPT